MLTQSSVNAAIGTAQELAGRGVRLFPVPNTPLAELVSASLKTAAVATAAGSESDFPTTLMAGAGFVDGVGHNTHDEIMENSIRAAGHAINFNMQLAKNVVNPMVERVAQAVAQAMEQFTSDASVPVSIHPQFDRGFWSSPYTGELFSRFSETLAQNVTYTGPAVPFDPAFLETRLEAFDVAVREYIAEVDGDEHGRKVADIWNASFGSGKFDTQEFLSGGRDSIDVAIVIYLGAQFLSGNPPEGTMMSAVAWDTMCNLIKAQAGRVVYQGLARLQRDRGQNLMVSKFPENHSVGQKIFVDGPTYNKFLQDGGTPEAVLGSYFSNRVTNSAELLSQRDGYATTWKTSQATLMECAVTERAGALAQALSVAVTAEINNLPDTDLVVERGVLHERLRDRMKTIHANDMDNLWGLVRKTICYVIYPHTDAEASLQAIDEQMNLRKDLSVREAALFAMFDQMAKWLAKQIQVEYVRV